MDAVKFYKEIQRVCLSYEICKDCILGADYCLYNINADNIAGAVDKVEKWIKEHPVKTNGMKFREVYGFNFPVGDMLTSEAEAYRGWLNEEYKEE